MLLLLLLLLFATGSILTAQLLVPARAVFVLAAKKSKNLSNIFLQKQLPPLFVLMRGWNTTAFLLSEDADLTKRGPVSLLS